MDIVWKRLDEITPYENNPRDNDQAVDAVASSIKEFGFKVPIVIDAQGVIRIPEDAGTHGEVGPGHH